MGSEPTDETTWQGVTRRNNLLQLAQKDQLLDVNSVKALMEVDIDNGGALWYMTIYQIVFQPENNFLSLRRPLNAEATEWVDIDLNKYY